MEKEFPVRKPIFVFQQRRLRNGVVSEFAFMWATCIVCNDFFLAAWTSVMSDFIFSNHNRLRLGNFLDNLRLNAKRSAKLCTAIRTSICCDLYKTLRGGRGSCYAFMPNFLAGLSLIALILFAIAATS